ncbi:MAG: site-specific DNA-methyltransferase [Propionivibrio sp.]|nr:site-specific DNA-methyltransferase [Propionivibrio sp.]
MMVLHNADCLEVMADMSANSVDAIITDPPYYKVKGEAWDNQWDTPQKFLAWVGLLCEQFERILKPNGSLYFFASPQMAARVECEIGKRFAVLNSITWRKGAAGKSSVGWSQKTEKEALRMWLPETERIIFAEHYGADNIAKGEAGYEAKCDELRGFVFEPLRAYLAGEFSSLGWNANTLNKICGTASMAGRHYVARSQWCLPTEEHYKKLQVAASSGKYLRREYEDLRREYEDLRREYEDLRRPFSVTARDQWSDVWDFDPVQAYPGKHPCEKPLPLLCHILNASTKPGAVVFDPFAGSASLGEACHNLGRQFIGVELCPENYAKAAQRIAAVKAQERLFA